MTSALIASIDAREILGGSGRPTIEVQLTTTTGVKAIASVASGTSKGRHEAVEVRDGGSRFRGLGCRRAVANVQSEIAEALRGLPVLDQRGIDARLIRLDGTGNKSRLGANALLAVSVACARAAATESGEAPYQTLCGNLHTSLPAPMATVIAGGRHSSSSLDFEDYLYILDGFASFHQAVEAVWEMRLVLEELLTDRFGVVPEDGGALAPPLSDSREAFDLMLAAAEKAGCIGKVRLGIDVAASEFYDTESGTYRLGDRRLTSAELSVAYARLVRQYPVVYIEDPFHQDDFESHARANSELPGVAVVGDDLFVSQAQRLRQGVQMGAANGVLLKVNQVGTVTEALEAAAVGRDAGYMLACSLRSHDTDDAFIADFAVAVGARLIKLGSPVRSERNAKYNRLMAIEDELRRAD